MSRSIRLGKVFTYSAIIILLTTSISAVRNSDAAASTSLFLEPPSQTVGAIGDSFTVNVSIADVSNLFAYELKLYYNSTLMNGTQVTEGPFLNESGGGQPFFTIKSFTDNYNSTYGIVYVACTLEGGNVPGVNGSGVLIMVQFKSLSQGSSVSLHLSDIELSDPTSVPISFEPPSDGTVTVVPEFTSLIAVLTLMTASLFVILVGKQSMRKVKNLNQ